MVVFTTWPPRSRRYTLAAPLDAEHLFLPILPSSLCSVLAGLGSGGVFCVAFARDTAYCVHTSRLARRASGGSATESMGCGSSKEAETLPPPPQPESRPLDNYSLEAINAKIAAKAAEATAAGPSAAPKQPQEFKRRFKQQHRASRRGLGRHKINRAGGVGSESNMSALVDHSEMEQIKSRMAAKAAARAAQMARSVTRRSRASHADGEGRSSVAFKELGPLGALAFVARLKGKVAHTLHLDHFHHASDQKSTSDRHPQALSFVSRLKSRMHLSHKSVENASDAASAMTAGVRAATVDPAIETEAITTEDVGAVDESASSVAALAVASPASSQQEQHAEVQC